MMTRIRPSLLACMILLFSLPVPFLQADGLLNADHDIAAAVDHYIDARMSVVNLTPSSPAPDSTLLRRTMLDLVGRIPTAAEARQYSASPSANKRLEMVKLLCTSVQTDLDKLLPINGLEKMFKSQPTRLQLPISRLVPRR